MKKELDKRAAEVLFLVAFCQLVDLAAPEWGLPHGLGAIFLLVATVIYAKAAV